MVRIFFLRIFPSLMKGSPLLDDKIQTDMILSQKVQKFKCPSMTRKWLQFPFSAAFAILLCCCTCSVHVFVFLCLFLTFGDQL